MIYASQQITYAHLFNELIYIFVCSVFFLPNTMKALSNIIVNYGEKGGWGYFPPCPVRCDLVGFWTMLIVSVSEWLSIWNRPNCPCQHFFTGSVIYGGVLFMGGVILSNFMLALHLFFHFFSIFCVLFCCCPFRNFALLWQPGDSVLKIKGKVTGSHLRFVPADLYFSG